MKSLFAGLSVLALVHYSGCAGFGTRSSPPSVTLPGVSYTEERLRPSDATLHFGPGQEFAGAPTTILTIRSGQLDGFIRMRKIGSVSQGESVPWAANAGAYLLAREKMKHYRWGEARSCLAQFTNEAYGTSPNNSDLVYQVAGKSTDGRYSVFGSFSVGHPKLPSRQDARIYKSGQINQASRHPDVRLIERARDRDFQPSIVRINGIIDRLQVRD